MWLRRVTEELRGKVAPVLQYLDEVELSEAHKHLVRRRREAQHDVMASRRPTEAEVRASIAAAINWKGGMSYNDAALYLSRVRHAAVALRARCRTLCQHARVHTRTLVQLCTHTCAVVHARTRAHTRTPTRTPTPTRTVHTRTRTTTRMRTHTHTGATVRADTYAHTRTGMHAHSRTPVVSHAHRVSVPMQTLALLEDLYAAENDLRRRERECAAKVQAEAAVAPGD